MLAAVLREAAPYGAGPVGSRSTPGGSDSAAAVSRIEVRKAGGNAVAVRWLKSFDAGFIEAHQEMRGIVNLEDGIVDLTSPW